MTEEFEAYVNYNIDRLLGENDAYFNLIECSWEAIPILIKAYEIENDAILCGAIIEVLIQFHDPGFVDFFAEALREDHQDIWDPAIDGLMSLASKEALEKLTNALEGDLDKKKREWIEEAVEQFQSQIDERTS